MLGKHERKCVELFELYALFIPGKCLHNNFKNANAHNAFCHLHFPILVHNISLASSKKPNPDRTVMHIKCMFE